MSRIPYIIIGHESAHLVAMEHYGMTWSTVLMCATHASISGPSAPPSLLADAVVSVAGGFWEKPNLLPANRKGAQRFWWAKAKDPWNGDSDAYQERHPQFCGEIQVERAEKLDRYECLSHTLLPEGEALLIEALRLAREIVTDEAVEKMIRRLEEEDRKLFGYAYKA